MSTNPPQSSRQAEQLIRAKLPGEQDFMEGTELWNSVCQESCLQADGRCVGALTHDAARRLSEWRDPEKKWGKSGENLLPLGTVARSMWLGTGVPEDSLNKADETIADFTLFLHKAQAGEMNWNNKLMKTYSEMRHEATCHELVAVNNRVKVKELRTNAKSAWTKGDRRKAAGLGEEADYLVQKEEKEANDFRDRHVKSLYKHLTTIARVQPQGTGVRHWTPGIGSSKQSTQGDQTVSPCDASKRDGNTEGSQSLDSASTKSRFCIAEAKPF